MGANMSLDRTWTTAQILELENTRLRAELQQCNDKISFRDTFIWQLLGTSQEEMDDEYTGSNEVSGKHEVGDYGHSDYRCR